MSESINENKRLRSVLHDIANDIEGDSWQLRQKAEDAIKVVPFKIEDASLPNTALLKVVKLHKEKIDNHEKTINSMLSFLNIWRTRELKMGNQQIAEAIQLTIESYSCHK